ncbi:Uncharacterised protein [Yersinia wautersii]|uniref:DUF1795 domain-containing protein n=2 Tax=Yersinia wautersii TaxID=1341643 RepID=A0ABM9THV5_9GAMM|nr:Uncharacterised protein [Yersinia wautersii]
MKKVLKGIFSVAIGLVFSIQVQAQILMERQQIPEQGISLNIPKGFLRMDETMKKYKYPSDNRPQVVFTNERGTVNLAMSAGILPLKIEQLDGYKDLLLHAMRNYQPAAESVIVDKGQKAWLLNFISKAIDTDIHNVMLITSFMDRGVIIAFNSTEELWNTYSDSAKASLLSITFDR